MEPECLLLCSQEPIHCEFHNVLVLWWDPVTFHLFHLQPKDMSYHGGKGLT
jgi:hypothetical protein